MQKTKQLTTRAGEQREDLRIIKPWKQKGAAPEGWDMSLRMGHE